MPPKGSRKSGAKRGINPEIIGKTNEHIFLWVPNLIGYVRVILACISLTYMKTHPKYCTATYVVSCLLDAFDGMAARALNQTSRFGAVLDMVTDRCTTSSLLVFLSSAYPSYALLFQGLISLDFSSHYFHMFSSLTSGSRSHKSVTKEQSRILWSYYNNQRTLFLVCAGNELFFVCLYLIKWYTKPIGIDPLTILPILPRSLLSSIPVSIWAVLRYLTWPQLLAFVTFPVCALKQVINVVQFYKAAILLVTLDREERYAAIHKG